MENIEYIKIILGKEKEDVLSRFKFNFVDEEKLIDMKLLWNSFLRKANCYPYEKLKEYSIDKTKEIYFYEQRGDEMYITTMKDILIYVDNMEPWDEIDAYIFDENMDWVIALTHEDVILTIGI